MRHNAALCGKLSISPSTPTPHLSEWYNAGGYCAVCNTEYGAADANQIILFQAFRICLLDDRQIALIHQRRQPFSNRKSDFLCIFREREIDNDAFHVWARYLSLQQNSFLHKPKSAFLISALDICHLLHISYVFCMLRQSCPW